MAMFCKDTPGKMDVANHVAEDDSANKGLKVRYDFTKESHIVDMMGPIHSDIFFQDRLILNGVRGFSSVNPDNIFLGHIPKQIVLVLVDTQAYSGTYSAHPFDFKHPYLTQVGVYMDGDQIPRKPLFLNFDEAGGQNVEAGYESLFSGTGKLSQDAGNQISRILISKTYKAQISI